MSFVPITLSSLQAQLQTDAHQMLVFIDWLNDRNAAYSDATIGNDTFLTNLGVAAGDRFYIEHFVTDVQRLAAFVLGNPQGSANIVRSDIDGILGVS